MRGALESEPIFAYHWLQTWPSNAVGRPHVHERADQLADHVNRFGYPPYAPQTNGANPVVSSTNPNKLGGYPIFRPSKFVCIQTNPKCDFRGGRASGALFFYCKHSPPPVFVHCRPLVRLAARVRRTMPPAAGPRPDPGRPRRESCGPAATLSARQSPTRLKPPSMLLGDFDECGQRSMTNRCPRVGPLQEVVACCDP